ncbi:hypothetical protein C8R48DRAFT_739240, partial [Suillus tomentosus]
MLRSLLQTVQQGSTGRDYTFRVSTVVSTAVSMQTRFHDVHTLASLSLYFACLTLCPLSPAPTTRRKGSLASWIHHGASHEIGQITERVK